MLENDLLLDYNYYVEKLKAPLMNVIIKLFRTKDEQNYLLKMFNEHLDSKWFRNKKF